MSFEITGAPVTAAELAALPLERTMPNGQESRRLAIAQPIPLGYHTLTVKIAAPRRTDGASTRLIVAPGRCYRPVASGR